MSLNIVKQFARDTDELQLPDAIGTGVTSGRGGQWGWVELPGRSTDELGTTDLIQLTATGANDLRHLIPAGAEFHFLIQWGLHSGDAYRADELRSDMTDGQANYIELGARRIEDNRFPQRQVLLGVDFSRDSTGRGVVGGIHKLTGTGTPVADATQELAERIDRVRSWHDRMAASSFEATPAFAEQIAWSISRSLHRGVSWLPTGDLISAGQMLRLRSADVRPGGMTHIEVHTPTGIKYLKLLIPSEKGFPATEMELPGGEWLKELSIADLVHEDRGSASEVLAAWLHAAAFDPSIEIADFAKWLREKDVDSPSYILTTFASQADPSAITNLQKHLDPAGERTTSSVERFTARALAGMISHEGQKILGRRDDPDPFDMEGLVEDQGTLYLLAEPEQMKIVRPVLSLIASEMVLAAEQVARHKTGTHKRLPLPFYAILDELRFGVRLPTLPYISNVLRKFGIDYVYACTNGGDEEALHGEADADILQTNATSIYGGFDKRSAPEINDVAGRASVVVASRGDDGAVTQSEEQRDVLTASDLQKLGDGGAVIVQGGTAPFLAYIPSTFEDKKLRKRMSRELVEVTS